MRWMKFGKIALLFLAFAFITLVLIRLQYPVLFHLSGSCACTDYSEEVEGTTLFNPFRGHLPESAADSFLWMIRQGQPLDVAPDFRSTDWLHLEHKPIAFEWRLRYRLDRPNRVSLYYQFTRLDGLEHGRWSSEGTVEVEKINGRWKAADFDVVW
jgi:hypothetical protein